MTEKIIIPNAPFVSDVMADFVNGENLKILKNDFTDNDSRFVACERADEKMLRRKILDGNSVTVYSNSENSLSQISKLFAGTDIADKINIFKDKSRFRELLKSFYPDFYYKKVTYDELLKLQPDTLTYPLVLKPDCGFLSMGVYPLYTSDDFREAIKKIQKENDNSANKHFSRDVVNFDNFLLEQMIDGDEYAVDAFFDTDGRPVVLNIFYHPFVSSQDVSDRIYVTSADLVATNLEKVTSFLGKIAKLVDLKNFPFHIELRKNGEEFIPIECNPLRFAGWCMTDLSYYAYGINGYDCFFNSKRPDWEKILAKTGSGFYYFSIAEIPADLDAEQIADFDYQEFYKQFSECYKMYRIDFRKNPVFAVLFGHCKTYDEVKEILCRDLHPFVIEKK